MSQDRHRQYFHSVTVDEERCCGRMACLRVCPTMAIRVRRGKASIIQERCIDCGECISACPSSAVIPMTDPYVEMSRFRHTVAIPSPVLYSQFSPDVLPHLILEAVKTLGFDDVCDISTACEEVGAAIDLYLAQHQGPWPLITSTCPAVVRLIQVKYPELTGQVLPIEVPREIAALKVRKEKARELGFPPEQIGIIYLTPCSARMISIKQPAEKERSALDGAIAIRDVYPGILAAVTSPGFSERPFGEPARTGSVGLGWARMGGIPNALTSTARHITVSGLKNVIRLLDDVETGTLKNIELLECYSCPGGCVGGTLAVENRYLARSKVISLMERYDRILTPEARELAARRYQEGFYFLEKRLRPRPLEPLDPDMSTAIEKMRRKGELLQLLPGIDCGACGSPTCQVFAEDVVKNEVELEECVFIKLEKLEADSNPPVPSKEVACGAGPDEPLPGDIKERRKS